MWNGTTTLLWCCWEIATYSLYSLCNSFSVPAILLTWGGLEILVPPAETEIYKKIILSLAYNTDHVQMELQVCTWMIIMLKGIYTSDFRNNHDSKDSLG